MSRQALAYATLLALPAGVATAVGLGIMSGRSTLGLAIGAALFVGVFAIVYFGATRGEADPTRAER